MQLKGCKFLSLFILTTLFFSCSKKEVLEKDKSITSALQFYSFIDGESLSKASGTSWDANDAIGIYMLEADQELSETSVVESNRRYTTTGTGVFVPYADTEMIYLPEEGNPVNFIAYYPYTTSIQNFIYPVKVNNQQSQEAIDLLYAYNKKAHTIGDNQSSFSFSHQLAKLILNISPSSSGETLDGLTVTIQGMKTEASLDLRNAELTVDEQSGKDIQLKTTFYATGKVLAEGLLLPARDLAGVKILFTLSSGETSTWTLTEEIIFEAGNRYIYDVTLKGGEIEQPVGYGYFESPAVSAMENTIFVQHFLPEIDKQHTRNFSLLYDTVYKVAYWVAYPLHSSYLGTASRTNAWAYDPQIEREYQPLLSSGWGISGTDRGHQLPSGDRLYSSAGNRTTFYYSNMTAQNSTLNQGIWANLESQVRTWSNRADTLYVVTGAMIQSSSDQEIELVKDNAGKDAARPKYYYKALASKQGDNYYTIAFKMDNVAIPRTTDFNNYRLSVTDLERETGFTFFPELSQSIKSTINTSVWQK